MKKIKNAPTYTQNKYFTVDGKIRCAIPDGYRHGENDKANANWSYVVPENTEKNTLHTYAKPFNFAITSKAINSTPMTENMMPTVELTFKRSGFFEWDTHTERVIVEDNCAFLYQGTIDDDSACLLVKGFLLSELGTYQFHAFYYPENVADIEDDDVIDDFFEAMEEWVRHTTCE